MTRDYHSEAMRLASNIASAMATNPDLKNIIGHSTAADFLADVYDKAYDTYVAKFEEIVQQEHEMCEKERIANEEATAQRHAEAIAKRTKLPPKPKKRKVNA